MNPMSVISPPDGMHQLFEALGDPCRLAILLMLERQGECHVGALVDAMHLKQPTVSHHLGRMRRLSLVAARREGKMVRYSLGGAANVRADGSLCFRGEGFEIVVSRTP